MKVKRFCLQCDDGTLLEHGARDLSFTRHTRTHTVPQVWGWHCPVCADCQFDDNEGERYGAAMDAFSAQVDAEIAASLRATRKNWVCARSKRDFCLVVVVALFQSMSAARRNRTSPQCCCSSCWIGTRNCSARSGQLDGKRMPGARRFFHWARVLDRNRALALYRRGNTHHLCDQSGAARCDLGASRWCANVRKVQ